jgi:hypothetical protein
MVTIFRHGRTFMSLETGSESLRRGVPRRGSAATTMKLKQPSIMALTFGLM